MLKISCRLSHFLTKWSFLAKVFCAPGSKSFFSCYSYRSRFLTQFFLIVNANKRTSSTMLFGYGKLQTKRPKKGIPPQRKRELRKHERLQYTRCQEREKHAEGWQREFWGSKDTNHGGKRVQMLAEDDYGAILKKKCTKMHMAQRDCRSIYHSSCLIVIM